MPYKISGTKTDPARVIILNKSDWSVESNTTITGSGSYEIEELEEGNKLVFGRTDDGMIKGYGNISPVEYVIPEYYPFDEVNQTTADITAEWNGRSIYDYNHSKGIYSYSDSEILIWGGGGSTKTLPASTYYLKAYIKDGLYSLGRTFTFHLDSPANIIGYFASRTGTGGYLTVTGGSWGMNPTLYYYPITPQIISQIQVRSTARDGTGQVWTGAFVIPVALS